MPRVRVRSRAILAHMTVRPGHPRARHRCGAALTGLLTCLLVMTGCTLNAGSGFADEFGRYLDTRSDVESHRIRGNNDLPGTGSADSRVELRAGLTDPELAAAISEIATHRTDQEIAHHNLTVAFPAENGDGGPATVSVFVRLGDGALGDTSPAALQTRIGQVRDFAAADPDLVELSATVADLHASTAGDPFVTAGALTDYLRTAPPGVQRATARSGTPGSLGVVSFDVGDPIDGLRPMVEILGVLPAGTVPRRWRASSQRPFTEPQFELDLPRGTDPAVLEAARRQAAALGVPLRALIAK